MRLNLFSGVVRLVLFIYTVAKMSRKKAAQCIIYVVTMSNGGLLCLRLRLDLTLAQ